MERRIVRCVCGILVLVMSGCSGTVKRLSAKEYYEQATKAYTREDYLTAADDYQELLDQYPLNPYAEEAQLKIAYSRYLDKKYTEALAAFSDFERNYPNSSYLPFVQYYRGMAYFEQMRSIDRDQSVTEKADDFFRVVANRYRNSPFATLAEQKNRECREALASHELYVIDFQLKRDAWLAAKARLRLLIEQYPETDAAAVGLARLRDMLVEEGNQELADLAAQALAARNLAAVTAPESIQNGIEDLPAPTVDPLLNLITALKKQENEARQLAIHPPGSEPAQQPVVTLRGEDQKILQRAQGKEAE